MHYNLTLITYRENWFQTCRQCVVDQGPSEFDVFFPKDLEEAEKLILKHEQRDFMLLVNGREYDYLYDEDFEYYERVDKILNKYWNRKL